MAHRRIVAWVQAMDSRVGRKLAVRKLAVRIPETGRDGLEGDTQPRLEEVKCSLEDTGCMDQTC